MFKPRNNFIKSDKNSKFKIFKQILGIKPDNYYNKTSSFFKKPDKSIILKNYIFLMVKNFLDEFLSMFF